MSGLDGQSGPTHQSHKNRKNISNYQRTYFNSKFYDENAGRYQNINHTNRNQTVHNDNNISSQGYKHNNKQSHAINSSTHYSLAVRIKQLENLPTIELKVNKNAYNALLDSGSSVSLISYDTFQQIKQITKVKYLSRNVKLHSITNEQIPFECCVSFSIKINNKSIQQAFFVTRRGVTKKTNILLGFDFMKENHAILDMKENKLHFASQIIQLKSENQAQNPCHQNETYQEQKCLNLNQSIQQKDNKRSTNLQRSDKRPKSEIYEFVNQKKYKKYNSNCKSTNNQASNKNKNVDSVINEHITNLDSNVYNHSEFKQNGNRNFVPQQSCIHSKNQKEYFQQNFSKNKNAKINKKDKQSIMYVNSISHSKTNEINDDNTREPQKIFAVPFRKTILQPHKPTIVIFKIPKYIKVNTLLYLVPTNFNKNISVEHAINIIYEPGKIKAIVENSQNSAITLGKFSRLFALETEFTIPNQQEFNSISNSIVNDNSNEDNAQYNKMQENENSNECSNFKINAVKCNMFNSIQEQEQMYDKRRKQLKAQDFDLTHLKQKEQKKVLNLLLDNAIVFSKNYDTLGKNTLVQPKLKLTHNFPITCKPYPINRAMQKAQAQEIQSLLNSGIIERSSSNYSFPCLFIKKKQTPQQIKDNQFSFRFVVDFRLLNKITENFSYPLNKVQDILQNLAGHKYYSCLDMRHAFMQIVLPESVRDPFTFITSIGKFKPTRLFFGAKNSTTYFCELMNLCLADLKEEGIDFFLDDLILAANSLDDMLRKLKLVFDRLIKYNLTLDPAKTKIMVEKANFLGFKISQEGITPSDQNITKINRCPTPKTIRQLKRFLGMTNYFRNLINNYSELTNPLTQLTQKGVKFNWSSECDQAFNKLQEIILNEPLVKPPDPNKKFYIATDASSKNIAGILMQKHENNMTPVSYFSRKLKNGEVNYDTLKKELLGIVESVKYFSEHLYTKQFEILTDCKSLTHHIRMEKQPEIVMRWLIYLQGFSFEISHLKGADNPSDYFSRENFDNKKYIAHILKVNNQLSMENFAKEQELDEFCQKIRKKLSNNDPNIVNNYCLHAHHDVLMRKNTTQNQNKTENNKIVVPKSLIKTVIQTSHVVHFGISKTINMIRKYYFWHGMYSDVCNFCRTCTNCLKFKPQKGNKQPIKIINKGSRPGNFISIDCTGPLNRSNNGYVYVLTITCMFSRYLTCIPLRNIKTSSIIKALTNYITNHGIPKNLISDNGSNFTSYEFQDWLKSLGIQHRKTSFYFSRSNGLCEARHLSIKSAIACMSDTTYAWDERMAFFQLFHNNSLNRVTKFSPAMVYFGRELNLPLDMNDHSDHKSMSLRKFVQSNKSHCVEVAKIIKENELKYFTSEVASKNKHLKPMQLNIGQTVFLKNFIKAPNLQARNKGPYIILRKFRNSNFLIQKDDERPFKVNSSYLISVPSQRQNIKFLNIEC